MKLYLYVCFITINCPLYLIFYTNNVVECSALSGERTHFYLN